MDVIDYSLILLAYLFGSISTAVVVCRLAGLPDPRTQGSKNPGATNVLRLGGRKVAAMTLGGDVAKGMVPVLIARAVSDDPTVLSLVSLAAFLGHLFPVFFGFKGGKGVATALGVLLGLSWPVALATLATWLLVAAALRISSLAAIITAVLTPVYMWAIEPQLHYLAMTTVMSALLLWRHRSNIDKLMAGEEKRIGEKD